MMVQLTAKKLIRRNRSMKLYFKQSKQRWQYSRRDQLLKLNFISIEKCIECHYGFYQPTIFLGSSRVRWLIPSVILLRDQALAVRRYYAELLWSIMGLGPSRSVPTLIPLIGPTKIPSSRCSLFLSLRAISCSFLGRISIASLFFRKQAAMKFLIFSPRFKYWCGAFGGYNVVVGSFSIVEWRCLEDSLLRFGLFFWLRTDINEVIFYLGSIFSELSYNLRSLSILSYLGRWLVTICGGSCLRSRHSASSLLNISTFTTDFFNNMIPVDEWRFCLRILWRLSCSTEMSGFGRRLLRWGRGLHFSVRTYFIGVNWLRVKNYCLRSSSKTGGMFEGGSRLDWRRYFTVEM